MIIKELEESKFRNSKAFGVSLKGVWGGGGSTCFNPGRAQ